MSHFHVDLIWKRTREFSYDQFNRDHTLHFAGGQFLNNSAAPEYFGNSEMSNPEELLASALTSCHMMTFLAVAAKSGYIVDSYADHAEAVLEKNDDGRMAITTINLKPVIVFSGDKKPDADQ